MGQLYKFGKRKRIYRTSIDRNHDHILKLGRARTHNAVYYDELTRLDIGRHHHPVRYSSTGLPTIGFSEGHDHQV